MHQERLGLEHVEGHVVLHHLQLLGQHLDRHRHRGGLFLLLQLFLLELLLELFHSGQHRVGRFLNLSLYHDDPRLRVDGAKGFFVGRPAALEEKVREHVAMVADKESVRHVGQFLRVLQGEVDGRGDLVCDDVIHVVSSA